MNIFKDIISGIIMFIPILVILILICLIIIVLKITCAILWIFGLKEYTLGKEPNIKISIKDKKDHERV